MTHAMRPRRSTLAGSELLVRCEEVPRVHRCPSGADALTAVSRGPETGRTGRKARPGRLVLWTQGYGEWYGEWYERLNFGWWKEHRRTHRVGTRCDDDKNHDLLDINTIQYPIRSNKKLLGTSASLLVTVPY